MKLNLRLRDKNTGELLPVERFDLVIDGAELAGAGGDTTTLLMLAMMGGSPLRPRPEDLWPCGKPRGFFSGRCGPGPHELHAVDRCAQSAEPHPCAQRESCAECNAVELGA